MLPLFSLYENEEENQRKKQDDSFSMQIVERERERGGYNFEFRAHTPEICNAPILVWAEFWMGAL